MPNVVRSLFFSSIMCICLFGALLVTGCAGGDMAKVRINISLPSNKIAHSPTIIDRMLSFLTLGTMLNAEPPPIDGPEINIVLVTVSGPEMDTITVDGNPATGYIELEVPSGSNRRFEIRAGRINPDFENTYDWYYSNETTVNLASGETKSLKPVMIGMPIISSKQLSESLRIIWHYYGKTPTDVIIQVSPSEAGPWDTIYPGLGTIAFSEMPKQVVYNCYPRPITSGWVRIKHKIGESSGLYCNPEIIE